MNKAERSLRGMAWLLSVAGLLLFGSLAASLKAQDFDDDGWLDEDENYYGWLYNRSESPYVMRCLNFDGSGDVTIDEAAEGSRRYAVSNWTVEAWVRPTQNVSGFTPFVSRRIDGLVNFEIGLCLTNGQTRIYTRVSRGDAAGNPFYTVVESSVVGGAVPLNEWTHVSATFLAPTAFANGAYILYRNGGEVARGHNPRITCYVGAGFGTLSLGSPGFAGDLMEVRVWSIVRGAQEVLDNFRRILLYNTEARENSFNGSSAATFMGRTTLQANPPTVTVSEDGYSYLRTRAAPAPTRLWHEQRFTVEAWVRMDPGSRGGVIARRKVFVGVLPPEVAPDVFPAVEQVVGGDVPADGWAVNYSLNVLPSGRLQAEWWGTTQIWPAAPLYRLRRRWIDSDVDLRDGQWHHVAVVGDLIGVRLYIDGAVDTEAAEYFTYSAEPAAVFYSQYSTVNSVLRIGQGGFDGTIDEVLIWNDRRTTDQINQEMRFGLTMGEVAAARVPMAAAATPLPPSVTFPAVTDGGPASPNRYRLVSYVVLDTTNPGETFVDDLANLPMPYRIYPMPSGSEIVAGGRPPILVDTLGRAFMRIMPGYFACSDGGLSVENYVARNMAAAAGWFGAGVSFVDLDHNLPADVGQLFRDGDGDGMPDWWETAHMLNPLSDDAFQDPDGDGLPNIAEFRADFDNGGTITDPVCDPWNGDTDGDGNGDFYSWNINAVADYRIFGERYTDFDGINDFWEVTTGLDPLRFEAVEDPDQDGWSNLGEFMSGVAGDCTFTRATHPLVPSNAPLPTLAFTFRYNGLDATGPLRILAYHEASMGGRPDATLTVAAGAYVFPLSVMRRGTGAGAVPFGTITNVTTTGIVREGPNYFFAFFDVNNNGTWNSGEPAGLAEDQPVNVEWGGAGNIVIGLTKAQANSDLRDYELAGYGRFAWPSAGSTSYRVYVQDTSGSNIVSRELAGPRTFFHEGDFRYAGLTTGLTELASWQWFVYLTNNTQPYARGNFGVLFPSSHAAPTPVTPSGSVFQYSRNVLQWTTPDPQDTRFLVQLSRAGNFSTVFQQFSTPAPFRERDGTQRYTLPIYAGDGAFTNGVYYWRVKGINRKSSSAFSVTNSFRVDLTAGAEGPFDIGGTNTLNASGIHYPGKVRNGTWIVQAFLSDGFGGRPEAQTRVANAANVADWPRNRTPFLLRGLPRGAYYVRAFLDQNGNDAPDPWETQGYVETYCRYEPADIMVPASRYAERLETMMRDTDNDRIADDWERYRFGNLTTAGPGSVPCANPANGQYTDSNNDGVNDYDSYALTPMNVDPTDRNAALADGIPFRVKTALGLDPLSPLVFPIGAVGLDAARQSVVAWSAVAPEGSARIDAPGRAVMASGDVELGYQMQYSADLRDWADLLSGGVIEYDAVNNEFRFVGAVGGSGPVYYRLRVFWSN